MATWLRRTIMAAPPAPARSGLDDEDVAGGLFAPDVLDRRADRPRDRILDRVRIAPPLLREGLEDVDDGLRDELGDRLPAAVPVRQAHEVDDRIAGDLAPPVDRDRDRNDAGKRKLAALRKRALACL